MSNRIFVLLVLLVGFRINETSAEANMSVWSPEGPSDPVLIKR